MKSVISICGPTAAGKTALALKVANMYQPSTVISIDSRQAYRGFPALTNQDIPHGFSEAIDPRLSYLDGPVYYYYRNSTKIYGQNFVPVSKPINAFTYSKFALDLITKELDQVDQTIVLVGGSGLYQKAIQNPLTPFTPSSISLRSELDHLDLPSLQKKLSELDMSKFSVLNNSDINNKRRLIRYIEIASSIEQKAQPGSQIKIHNIGIRIDLSQIKERLAHRIPTRLDAAIREVSVAPCLPEDSLPIFTSTGAKHICDYIDKKITKKQLVDLWLLDELHYAKRQITWYKKDPSIIWYDYSKAYQAIKKIIEHEHKN